MKQAISQRLVPIAFWLGLIAAIAVLWLTGLASDAWAGLRTAYWPPLVLVVVSGMTLPIVHALRWRIVMQSLDTPLRPIEAANITVSASLLNYASPGFVGASAKALLANQTSEARYRDSALSIAFEHSLDLGMMLITSIIAILLLGPAEFRNILEPLQIFTSTLVIFLTLVIVSIAVFVSIRFRLHERGLELIRTVKLLGRRVDGRMVASLTFLYWFLQVIVVGLLFWALNVPIQPLDILAVATIPTLAGMLAPVPGGLGVREATIVALTSVTGVSAASMLVLALVQRVLLVAALPLSLGAIRGVSWFGGRKP